jgi:D-alanyl-D-alanine carboxypeptidase-like protein
MTAVRATSAGLDRPARAAKAYVVRWPPRAGWLSARAQVVAGLALAVLLAVGACGAQSAPQGSPPVPRPSRTTVTSTGATTSPAMPRSPAPAAVFVGSASALDTAARKSMTGVSWHPGCPVPLADLRLLRLNYWGFDARVHRGELIVNADATSAVLTSFRLLFAAHYRIHRMRPVEAYGGSDERSMLADNTSAFNCRGVPGSTAWSQHAYGRAVDINPLENPEVRGSQVDPPAAYAWADRSRTGPAVIHHGDAAWQAFAVAGWTWGGDWSYPLDYMHFSANGL